MIELFIIILILTFVVYVFKPDLDSYADYNSYDSPDCLDTLESDIKYGDVIRIKSKNTQSGYLSPCDIGSPDLSCGTAVTLMPDSEFGKSEPGSALRNWVIEGKPKGILVKSGDIVKIRTLWSGNKNSGMYLSPCGMNVTANCGANVTLRPDNQYYNQGGDNSGLRTWQITGLYNQSTLKSGDTIRLQGQNTQFTDHNGFLSICGFSGSCGSTVVLLPLKESATYQQWEINAI